MQKDFPNNRPEWATRVANYESPTDSYDTEESWNRLQERYKTSTPAKSIKILYWFGCVIVAAIILTIIALLADKFAPTPHKRKNNSSNNGDTILIQDHVVWKLTNNGKTKIYLANEDSLRNSLLEEKRNSKDTSFTNNNPKIEYLDKDKLVWTETWEHGCPISNGPVSFPRFLNDGKPE